MACTPKEDLDQPGHAPSLIRMSRLIRVFAVRISYPFSAQRRLWSDWDFVWRTVILLILSWDDSHYPDTRSTSPGSSLLILIRWVGRKTTNQPTNWPARGERPVPFSKNFGISRSRFEATIFCTRSGGSTAYAIGSEFVWCGCWFWDSPTKTTHATSTHARTRTTHTHTHTYTHARTNERTHRHKGIRIIMWSLIIHVWFLTNDQKYKSRILCHNLNKF